MSNEHQKAAQRIFNDQGKVKGLRDIQRNLADVVRGGDPDIISYWKSVLEAFEAISRKSR